MIGRRLIAVAQRSARWPGDVYVDPRIAVLFELAILREDLDRCGVFLVSQDAAEPFADMLYGPN